MSQLFRRAFVASTLALGVTVPAALRAQAPVAPAAALKNPPTQDSLNAITIRGRLLAEYDYVAWHASDSIAARKPAAGVVQGYVSRLHDDDDRWDVVFGKPSANRDTFFVAYLVRQRKDDPESFDVFTYSPARPDTGYFARAHRAIAVATADFGQQSRPYNPAVIERPNGMLWVYLVPAQLQMNVYPLGGDVRYLFPADGKAFVAKRQLHRTIIEYGSQRASGSNKLEAGVHTAILDDIPEDTDVMHVILRQPSVPEFVVTDAFEYVIAPNGAIRLMERRKNEK